MYSDHHREKRSDSVLTGPNSDRNPVSGSAEPTQISLGNTVASLQGLNLNSDQPPSQKSSTHKPELSYASFSPLVPTFYCQTAQDKTAEGWKKRFRPRPIYVATSKNAGARNLFSWAEDQQHPLKTLNLLSEAQKKISSSYQPASGTRPVARSTHLPAQCTSTMATRPSRFPYSSTYPLHTYLSTPTLPSLPSDLPLNYHTSPNRVHNALLVAGRTSKHGWPALPPPAYIYTRTDDPDFNIFGGILLYPELCFALASNLPVDDLLGLYAISKDFHTIVDKRFATVILNQSLRKCPESSRIFPFRCYKHLCQPDPVPRIPHPHPGKQAAGEVRRVPGFRWLKMVMFRDKVCHEILTIMAEDGLPLPNRCESALKKMWFLMDIPDNARRVGYMHTMQLVSDLDLYFMMCFIVKLDLRFNDPVATNRHHGLKKVILTQRGLLPLWRMLRRNILRDRYEIIRMWTGTKYVPPPQDEGLPMFGVSGDSIGKLRMEYWGDKTTHDTGKPCTVLMRPDQLIMREVIKRQMIFSKHFLRSLLWGYIDVPTLHNYPPRPWKRRIQQLKDEYADDDECGGRDISSGGVQDELLDLGIEKPISILVQRNGK